MPLAVTNQDYDTDMRLEMYPATENIRYMGTCKAGNINNTADTVWKICEFSAYTAGGTPTIKSYADGDSSYSKVRDDRATYTYGA